MLDFNADFGHLRSLLSRRPEAPTWQRICEIARRWRDDPRWRERAEPYAARHLESWPDALRVLPPEWMDLAIEGRPLPSATWFRKLTDSRRMLLEGELLAIASNGGLTGLREVELNYRTHSWDVTRALGELAGSVVRFSSVDVHMGSSIVDALGRAETRWVALDVSGNRIRDRGALALEQGAPFSTLEELGVGRNEIGEEGARALARAPWMPGVRELDLSGNVFGARGERALAESGACAGVERLRVGDRSGGAATLTSWASAEARVGALRELDVSACEVDGATLRALLEGASMGALESLKVRLRGEGALARGLAAAPCLATLRSLEIVSASHDVLGELATLEGLEALEELEVRGDVVMDSGAAAVSRAPWLEGLRVLRVRAAPLEFASASELVGGALDLLEVLDLRVRVGDELVEAMTARSGWGRLTELVLSADRMSARGARELLGSPELSRLERLSLYSWTRSSDERTRFDVAARGLDVLRLVGGVVSEVGLDSLLRETAWDRLHTLELRPGVPADVLARALKDARGAPELHTLALGRGELSAEGAGDLARALGGSSVRALDLSSVRLGAEGVEALLTGSSGLEELDLRGSRLDRRATDAIAGSRELERLVRLELDTHDLSGEQLEGLLAAPNLGGSVKCWLRRYMS